jgi:U32 family peptidase
MDEVNSMKKPELLITAANVEEVERFLIAGADAVTVGHEQYALRVPGNFSLSDIEQAVKIAHGLEKKLYVSMNALMHNEDLVEMEEYVRNLSAFGVDAIVFGDPAVMMTVQDVAPEMKLHWNTETTATNYETVRYWAAKGAKRALLARELSLEAVLETKRNVEIEIEAQIHGMTCIFHSRRELVSNYFEHLGMEERRQKTRLENRLFVKETKREEQAYPIFEDKNGTHIMSANDICMIEHLEPFLAGGIDSLRIEGILKTAEYNEAVVRIYRQAIDLCAEDAEAYRREAPRWLEEIKAMQPDNRPLDTGFYFKEQIY